jgi:predicted nucleotidyltransferase
MRKAVILFGSIARVEANMHSDVDLAVMDFRDCPAVTALLALPVAGGRRGVSIRKLDDDVRERLQMRAAT